MTTNGMRVPSVCTASKACRGATVDTRVSVGTAAALPEPGASPTSSETRTNEAASLVDSTSVAGTTVANSEEGTDTTAATAAAHLAYLFGKLARLYTGGEASTLSQLEAAQLARSLEFALGLRDGSKDAAMRALATADSNELFAAKQRKLACRIDAALGTWKQIIALMPPIRNIALRDTLASIGQLKTRYDIYFAAHEVPCDIDYQLSRPVDPALEGIDYIEAYLAQLFAETHWIAQFTPESCIAVLERVCPDYRGLHVNLCDLLRPHEDELQQREQK